MEKKLTSLEKALKILTCFSHDAPQWTLSSLARELKLPKPTVHRMVKSLEAWGMLLWEETEGCYKPGLKLFELGKIVEKDLDIKSRSLPVMAKLREQTGGTVFVAKLEGTFLIMIEVIQGQEVVRINTEVGQRFPLNFGAAGKVLCAYLPQPKVLKLIGAMGELPKHTAETIDKEEVFFKELEQVRSQGFAISNEEGVVGVRAVAAPIKGRRGNVEAAVGIVIPAVYLSMEAVDEVAVKVVEAAAEISRRVGGQ